MRRSAWVLAAWLGAAGCGEKNEVYRTTVLPTQPGSALLFRGYVTDDQQELVGQIHNFARQFSHVDTVDGVPLYGFFWNNERFYFYEEEDGTLRQLVTLDLSRRLVPYGLLTPKPVLLRYWETVFKANEGVGTTWQVRVDTTVEARDASGTPVSVRYLYDAKARFEGWNNAAIPESQTYQKVLDVHWYDQQTVIVNLTAGDSLFVQRGTAHAYFDPKLGLIKYINDYRLKDRKHAYVSRHGTWELIEIKFPPPS